MNALPSSAYDVARVASVSISSVQATVASIPRVENFGSGPTFISKNAPVPKVHFASPGSVQSWPNSAAC